MRDIKLSVGQAEFLRAQPLGTARNKVGAALGLVQATQSELSALTGLSESDISEVRNGKYQRLSLQTAQRIAVALGVSTDDLFPPPPARVDRRTRKTAKATARKRINPKPADPKAKAA